MPEKRTVARDTVLDDGLEHGDVIEKEYAPGAEHHDEEAGGAVAGPSPEPSSTGQSARLSEAPSA